MDLTGIFNGILVDVHWKSMDIHGLLEELNDV